MATVHDITTGAADTATFQSPTVTTTTTTSTTQPTTTTTSITQPPPNQQHAGIAITKLWYLTIKPSIKASSSDTEFTSIWTSIFAWLNTHDGTTHQLWQNLSIPQSLVLISGWPSDAARKIAYDSAEEVEFGQRLTPFVESKGYKQLNLDINSIPLTAPILSIETFSVIGTDSNTFEAKALAAQSHVTENTAAIAAVGAWDIFPTLDVPEKAEEGAAKMLESELPGQKTWVSITGWKDEETHAESARAMTSASGLPRARETVEATPNVYETVHLRKLMG